MVLEAGGSCRLLSPSQAVGTGASSSQAEPVSAQAWDSQCSGYDMHATCTMASPAGPPEIWAQFLLLLQHSESFSCNSLSKANLTFCAHTQFSQGASALRRGVLAPVSAR